MRGANIVLVMLAVGLLVFGCTSPTPPAKPGESGGDGTAAPPSGGGQGVPPSGSGTGDSSQGGTQPGDGTVPEGDQSQGEAPDEGSGGGQGGDDLAGMGYGALAAMGVPLECDITVNSTTMKVYMKGSGEVRSEFTISGSGSTCRKMVSVMKGDDYYSGCSDGTLFPGCDWLHTTAQDSGGDAGQASAEPPDYDSIPPMDIDCRPWVYDASKFATPGKACTMEELMQQYQKQYQQGDYPGGYE